MQGSGFRVQGSGFRVQGSGFRVSGFGLRVQGGPGLGAVGILAQQPRRDLHQQEGQVQLTKQQEGHVQQQPSSTLPLATKHSPVQRFRGGLVSKAHRLCVSLNSRRGSNIERRGLAYLPSSPAAICSNKKVTSNSKKVTSNNKKVTSSSKKVRSRERLLSRQPTVPNPLNNSDDFSRPSLRHESLNSLFQVALYLPSGHVQRTKITSA